MTTPETGAPRWPRAAGAALAAVFVAQALLFLRQAGLQADEAMFLAAVFDPMRAVWSWDGPFGRIPLMLMPYLGATKSLAWAPFAHWIPAGPVFVRLPVVLFGALTVWMLYRLIAKLANREAAFIAAGLLAVDTAYVITTTYDWAPVAVQALCITVLANLAVGKGRRESALWGIAGLLLAFIVWNKAVVLFNLGGFAIAALACVRVERNASPRNLIPGALGFLAGCFPLIAYNATQGFATWGVREALASYSVAFKLKAALATLDAGIFNGYMFATNGGSTLIPRHNLMPAALFLCAAAFPFLKTGDSVRRLLVFAWLSMLGAFALMLPFRNAGAGPQHIVLLYPLPHVIIGITVASVAQRVRAVARIAAAMVALSCLAVTCAYAVQCRTSGFSVYWTDAIYALHQRLAGQGATRVVAADWGIVEPLVALSRGRIACTPGYSLDAAGLRRMAAEGALVVRHSDDVAIEPGQTRNLRRMASEAGVGLAPKAVISDPHGRAMFEIDALIYAGTRAP